MFRSVYLRYLRDHILPLAEIRGVQHASCMSNRSVVLTKASTSAIMTHDSDVTKYFEVAKELTLEAGKILKRGFEEKKDVASKEFEWDLVTTHDRRVEEVLIRGLCKAFPDHKIIAEEQTSGKELPELTDSPTWFIDPIDGTTNFIHSFPQTCISVALAICKQIVIGIIYNPINSELYFARKGEGAFLNGNRIRTSGITDLKKALVAYEATAIRVLAKYKDIIIGRMEALVTGSQGTRNVGSAALTMAYIARGIIDCFQMEGLKPWDVAAGFLLIHEAGGIVIDTKGGPYNIMKPSTLAASTEELASDISKLIIDIDLKIQRKRLQRTGPIN